jgi:hypothetical protein
MKRITDQRDYQRAKRDLEMVDGQLAGLEAKRETAIAGFDQAVALLREQRGEIAGAMQVWRLRPDVARPAKEGEA